MFLFYEFKSNNLGIMKTTFIQLTQNFGNIESNYRMSS